MNERYTLKDTQDKIIEDIQTYNRNRGKGLGLFMSNYTANRYYNTYKSLTIRNDIFGLYENRKIILDDKVPDGLVYVRPIILKGVK